MKFRFCGDLDCPDWVLSEIATLSKMSSVRIKIIVVQIMSYCIQGTFNYEKVLKLAADNTEGISDIKGSVAALHFIVTNAAKYDVDEQSLVQEIQQLGLPKENSDNIGKAYREHKDNLRVCFANESYRVSRLLNTEWRVDQVIASSTSTTTDLHAVVHLKFSVDTRPQDGELTGEDVSGVSKRVDKFACELSIEKLDLLIHELSTANNLLTGMQS